MIYILFGEDDARQEYKLETIKENSEYDLLDRVDAAKIHQSTLLEMLDSYSLLLEKNLIIVENATFLSARNTTSIDPEKIASRNPEDKIIVYKVPSKKLDSRKKAVKTLMEQATVMECLPLDERSIQAAVSEMLKDKHMKMDRESLEWFCAHAGYDCLNLSAQLDKIGLCSSEPDLKTVQALTTVEPVSNVFKMTDALFARQGTRLLALYRSFRAQNMEPAAINGLLASQIRFVFQVRVCMDQGMNKNEIASFLHASPGRIYNSMKNASRFSASELLGHLDALSTLDQEMKSGQVQPDDGFEKFIFSMIGNGI
ncbi:MAG: DNA polymerase III subunit delta [Erysipelotrichaceae bacterium]|nr:DNA polymerase III subunit delta [Erysipelotrichaceae bacterium]